MPRPHRLRAGVTLMEIAIVVAIMGILAAMAGTLFTGSFQSWRTRRAAKEFAVTVNMCRQLAIAQNVEYRIHLDSYDTDLDGSGPSTGLYYVCRGNASSGSTAWDILPWDVGAEPTATTCGAAYEVAEGAVDISDGGDRELPGVSIQDWNTDGWTSGDITFSPRGWVSNAVSEFNSDGYLEVTFVNKTVRQMGGQDEWTAMVARGGMVRVESNRQPPVGNASGTSTASAISGGEGFTGSSTSEEAE